jgi:hypothetical protein
MGSVFAEQRAVFMPFDSENYAESDVADATQAEHLVILPVKAPFAEHWLSGYIGASDVNESIQMITQYSLCVNDQIPDSDADAARAFIEWLVADRESIDVVQRCMTGYHESGLDLPLLTDNEREDEGGMAVFGDEVYGSALRSMLSDPEWLPDEITALRDAIYDRWLSSG